MNLRLRCTYLLLMVAIFGSAGADGLAHHRYGQTTTPAWGDTPNGPPAVGTWRAPVYPPAQRFDTDRYGNRAQRDRQRWRDGSNDRWHGNQSNGWRDDDGRDGFRDGFRGGNRYDDNDGDRPRGLIQRRSPSSRYDYDRRGGSYPPPAYGPYAPQGYGPYYDNTPGRAR